MYTVVKRLFGWMIRLVDDDRQAENYVAFVNRLKCDREREGWYND